MSVQSNSQLDEIDQPITAPKMTPNITWSIAHSTSVIMTKFGKLNSHNQLTRNHLPNATRVEDSTVRYIEILRNG